MSSEPPQFQEASRCDICSCSFNTFRRRHHCRCCGRTLCAEHSTNQMALPQFGLHSSVRVCGDCFNNSSRPVGDGVIASANEVNVLKDSFSTLDVGAVADIRTEDTVKQTPAVGITECKCGMPLCICQVTNAPTTSIAPQERTYLLPFKLININPKPKKENRIPTSRASTSDNKQGTTFNIGPATSCNMERVSPDYEVSGEGLREAIKNGDVGAAKKLLSQGVDANYRDKQGSSLLHLAAVFNRTEIAFALMDSGASLYCKNSQGETPLDCAPATLQFKMRKKTEGNGQ
ncbi:myotubularin-related protein 3 isoform X2 [Capsicum annuum]